MKPPPPAYNVDGPRRSRASRKKSVFLQSVNYSLTALLVERSEPGAMCYTIAARPDHGEALNGAKKTVHDIDNDFLLLSF